MRTQSDLAAYISKRNQLITLSDAIDLVGGENKFQWRQLILLCLIMATISICGTSGSYTFIQPPLLCDDTPCEQVINHCENHQKIQVNRTDYDFRTIVTEFELWCGNKYLQRLAQSIYFLGCIFGGVIMSFLGDKYGRKPAYLVSLGIICIGVIGINISNSIEMYIVMNFILGFGAMPPYLLNYIIINETSGKNFRQKASIGTLIAWSVAEIATSGIFYIIKDWKQAYLYFVTIPFCLLFLLAIFIIKETPSFYCTKNKYDEMIKSLDGISQVNNTMKFSMLIPSIKDKLSPQLLPSQKSNKHQQSARTYSWIDLFKYKSLRYPSFGFMIVSFTLNLIYYGGQYSIASISSGNALYILGAAMGFSEFFTYLVIRQFIHRIKRRRWTILSYVFSLVCCGSFIFFDQQHVTKTDQIIILTLACLIRVFNSLGFAVQGLFATEFYPTCVRSLGTGFIYAVGVLGSFFSPYSIAIGEVLQINPYLIIGLLSLSGPFATILISETLGKPLRDQIEEDEHQIKHKSQ